MSTTAMRWTDCLRRFTRAQRRAWGRNKSLRASDIILGMLCAMLVVLGLAFVLTHLLSATAGPAAGETELLEPPK